MAPTRRARGRLAACAALSLLLPLAAAAAGALVFPYGGSVLEAGADGVRRIASWPGAAGPRDARSYPGGFVAFERKSGDVYRWDGALRRLGRIEAAELFLSPSRVLARGRVFEPRAGFSFQLWELEGGGLARGPSLRLDCFPSDCAYAAGRWYLAGADAADSENSLYEIDPETGKARVLARLPRSRDFGRVVAGADRLWFYLSPAMPGPRPAEVLSFALSEADGVRSGPERVELAGLGKDACLYGSGIAQGGCFWLPVASGTGKATRVVAARFDPAATSAKASPLGSVELATGIYAPIGEADGRAYAYGFLYVRDPATTSLLSFGPEGLGSWKLP